MLCLNSQWSNLGRVSTTCGSGWVRSHARTDIINQAKWLRTDPLPQVVLTLSKQLLRRFKRSWSESLAVLR